MTPGKVEAGIVMAISFPDIIYKNFAHISLPQTATVQQKSY